MKNKHLFSLITIRILLGITSILVGGFALGYITEITSGAVENQLIKILGKENVTPFLLFASIVSAIILIITYVYEGLPSNKSDTTEVNDRKILLNGLRSRYQYRLNQKMNYQLRFEIKLKLKYSIKGTSKETISENFIIRNEVNTGPIDKIVNAYVKKIRRLLILGNPGSGKTVLLLKLALKLISIAEKNPNFPIPIILNLVSWNNNDISFEEWLKDSLPVSGGEFGISKEYSKQLIDGNSILPLLDGFDEIPKQFRNSCFDALKPYLRAIRSSRKNVFPEVIICSRIEEYYQADDAPVFASISISPLERKDIEKSLLTLSRDNDLPAKKLLSSLTQNKLLANSIDSAFLVHSLLNLQLDKFIANTFTESKEKIRQHIVSTYIDSEINKKELVKKYDPKDTKKWLGWLAWQLNNNKKSVTFELSDLQPYWSKYQALYLLTNILICMLVLSILLFYKVGFFFEILGSYFYFFMSMATIFVFSIIPLLITRGEIKTKEKLILSPKSATKQKLFIPLFGSIGMLLLIIFSYLFDMFFDYFAPELFKEVDSPTSTYLSIMVLIIIFGTIYAILASSNFVSLNKPYERLKSQFFRDIFQWVLVMLLIFIVPTFISNEELTWNRIEIALALGFSVSLLQSPLFNHFILRSLLVLQKLIPLRLVSFLTTTTTTTGLLEKDGGQWRFRHQLIQDDLSNWFEQNYFNLLPYYWQKIKSKK